MRPRRARRRGAGTKALLLGGLSIVALAVPALVVAAQSWSIAADVITLETGIPTDVAVTITNTSGNNGGGESIGCVRIEIPPEFTVGSVSVTSVTTGWCCSFRRRHPARHSSRRWPTAMASGFAATRTSTIWC